MAVYYLMMEAVPKPDNPEGRELGGAYVNCWVKADSQTEAQARAKEYIEAENWACLQTEEVSPARREAYLDEPESLACFDEAVERGISAVFYAWPLHESPVN